MSKAFAFMVLVLLSVAAFAGPSFAQTKTTASPVPISPVPAGPVFEKKQFTYEDWIAGRFSEIVTVTGPGKLIFLAGIGAWDEVNGATLFPDNFMEQCRFAYAMVRNRLAAQGATMGDIVRQTAYIVDVRNQKDYGKCRSEAFEGTTLPASTGVYVAALGLPYLLFEVEITAAIAK
jgi:2-iminobutanoate/2-iminopropanoate deaminase